MRNLTFFLFLFVCCFSACIGDDIVNDRVPERLDIDNPIDSLQVDSTFQLMSSYFNEIGQKEEASLSWTSSDASIASIDANGLISGVSAGEVTLSVEATAIADGSRLFDDFELIVTEEIVEEPEPDPILERPGVIETTSFYDLEGDFVLRQEGTDLIIDVADNYIASTGLPGFYLYLTNNPNTANGAFEVSEITVFEGAHSYTVENMSINEYDYLLFYCKPFSVKVGQGNIE